LVYEIVNDKISQYKDFDSFKNLSNPFFFLVIWLLKKLLLKENLTTGNDMMVEAIEKGNKNLIASIDKIHIKRI
jgi:hypothetical protein